MAQYIDKFAVVAEIERRIASLEGTGSEGYLHDKYPEQYAMLVTLKSLKFSINALEVKEVDLEKEIKKYIEDNICGYCVPGVEETAKHFFELGLKTQTKNIPITKTEK